MSLSCVEGCIGFGLPRVPRDPKQISRERAVLPFTAGGSGRSENFVADPRGTVEFGVHEVESMHEVEKKIKAAVYLTKAKQGKSDIWKQFSTVTEKMGKS